MFRIHHLTDGYDTLMHRTQDDAKVVKAKDGVLHAPNADNGVVVPTFVKNLWR